MRQIRTITLIRPCIVLTAYLNPVVDTSSEKFSWGIPDFKGLVLFCRKHIGWTSDETEKLLKPVVEKIESSPMRQTRIDSFMTYEDGIKFGEVRSKRLREVLAGAKEKAEGSKRQKQDNS